jgi:hypothetical protein
MIYIHSCLHWSNGNRRVAASTGGGVALVRTVLHLFSRLLDEWIQFPKMDNIELNLCNVSITNIEQETLFFFQKENVLEKENWTSS